MENFKGTKRKFKKAFIDILNKNIGKEINETALPAYAHKNPVIDFLFWKRLSVCLCLIRKQSCVKILDFGCGTGLFSYLLAKEGFEVTGVDLSLRTLRLIEEKIEFSDQIEFVEGNILTSYFENNSFDLIVALDSLEHVDNLEEHIRLFKRLLRPEGLIIVSGPTENIFYKIGRKLAGRRFTGEYHMTDIKRIKQEFSFHFELVTIKKLFAPIVFFEIFTVKNAQSVINESPFREI